MLKTADVWPYSVAQWNSMVSVRAIPQHAQRRPSVLVSASRPSATSPTGSSVTLACYSPSSSFPHLLWCRHTELLSGGELHLGSLNPDLALANHTGLKCHVFTVTFIGPWIKQVSLGCALGHTPSLTPVILNVSITSWTVSCWALQLSGPLSERPVACWLRRAVTPALSRTLSSSPRYVTH